jgi:signal transduction histidine kinase
MHAQDAGAPPRRARTDPGFRGGWRCALLAGLLTVVAASSDAQPVPKQVLMLHSLNRGNLVLDHFTGDFRVRLDRQAGKPVNVVQVVVGPTGFVGASNQAVVDYVRSLYADRAPPDLVMSVGGPAAAFTRQHRRQLFPETPLLFAAVDHRYLRDAPLSDNETAVAVVNDFPRLIDDILRLLPGTKQVFMVIGSGSLGRFWRRVLEAEFARFRDRLTFIWSDDLSLPDMMGRVANLPSHSAIVYLTFGTDAQGGAYADQPVLADLHAAANAPMFSAFSSVFGHGIVGGSMMSIGDLAGSTADVAGRLLNGATPASLRIAPLSAGGPMFDWRELQKWGIPESRLPPGSVVHFRGPSLWDEYKRAVLAAIGVLVLQSLLIAALLYERRARRRAELDSRQNLAMATDTNRRETFSALASSIGHELGQPLIAIRYNAQALQMMVGADQAAPDETREILADIEAEATLATQIIDRHRALLRSHQLHKKPIDLRSVVDESLGLVAHDTRQRQVETILDLSSTPCVVDGDQVLLVQVLVNLLRNAIDALAETPASSRQITIRTAGTAASVEISVSDTGAGLPAEIVATLFTPFATTKAHGLGVGLAIAQRIVEAHGGTIGASDNRGAGATFTVTLPRSASGSTSRSP